MIVRDACPECGSDQYKKKGHTRYGKQNHRCKACERQFVAPPEDRHIADEQRTLIEYLLLQYPRTFYTDLNGLFCKI